MNTTGASRFRASSVAVALISWNEEAAVVSVIRDIQRAAPGAEIILVDSSSDRTAELAEGCGATVIRQLPPAGYGIAMMTALQAAAKRAEVVVTLDCDGTYPAERIPELARLVLEEGWDVVNASRLRQRPKSMPWGNWVGNLLFASTARTMHGVDVSDVHSGMRAYRSSMLEAVRFQPEGAALPVELLIKPARLGYRITEVAIPYGHRLGTSTLNRLDSTLWTFRRLLRMQRIGRRPRRWFVSHP